MNKSELSQSLANQTGLNRHMVEVLLGKLVKTIEAALLDGKPVALAEFGVFSVKPRAQRMGRNPRTGERIVIPASRTVVFKPAKALRARLSAVDD